MINDDDADADLRDALDTAHAPHGTIDNVMRVHCSVQTQCSHMKLYRAVLHDEANTLPTWLQEVIGSYVSALNKCDYSCKSLEKCRPSDGQQKPCRFY